MQKNLTIVAVDTAYPELTRAAVNQAVQVTGSEKVLILSNQDICPGSRWIKIDPIDHKEYNRIVFNDLVEYVDTEHFMIVQYDGMPIDRELWDNRYLDYDYIGAPWPWHPEGRNVGNGGFSIRSRRLTEVCKDLEFNPPGSSVAEDEHICHVYRNELDSQGIKFAPTQLARKFSAEIPGGRFDTYGFHGTLCLPYYLSDAHMELYINNMTERQFTSDAQVRILFGLYQAERWDLMELMMDRGVELIPDFKQKLIDQLPKDRVYFPDLTVEDLENVLVNYS